MTMRVFVPAVVLMLLGASAAAAQPQAVPLSEQESDAWLLHVIPLPKEARIEARLTVPIAHLGAVVPQEPEPPYANLLEAISQALAERGAESPPSPAEAFLTFEIAVLDERTARQTPMAPLRERLRGLENADQAYMIARGEGNTVLIGALDPKGLYYGLLTMWQLMEPTLRQEEGVWVVDVPLANIVDWPDLAERGLWGGSANRDIEWMAERKMNLVESHCRTLRVTDEGKGVAEFDVSLIERGAACALRVVPVITHLDLLDRTGIFRVFPDALGEGDPSTWPYEGSVKPACFSNPKTAQVLADWMLSLAEQPEVTDINVWLSEHHVACACAQCAEKGQFVLEAEAVTRGWELARQVRPDLGLRVLLTQGSYRFNDEVIATLPREIGISYYDGGRTYDSTRNAMIYPLLEEYLAEGGWLGCYPQVTASWRIVCPWSGPQFIRFRMTEFVDKGLESLCGYATPDNRFYDFNVTAAAEWSWNAHGRDERAFALAYFTQKGVAEVEKAADWAVLLGPVGWDVYGARVPYPWFFGRIGRALRAGNLPALGEGPFLYMPDEEHIAANLETCAQAMELAREVGDPALIAETQVIEGYVKMLQAIHALREVAGGRQELTEKEQAAAGRLMARLDEATHQTAGGLRAWQETVAPDARASRFDDTVRVTEETCVEVSEFLESLGVDDPGRPYRAKLVGEWKTEDFAEGPGITKRWEVTERISGPGRYLIEFVYRRGWFGLNIHRASLMSAPADAPDALTRISTDEHRGSAAHRSTANVYEFDVAAHDPDLRYFVVAEVHGAPLESPPERQGCEGEVFFRKERPGEAR